MKASRYIPLRRPRERRTRGEISGSCGVISRVSRRFPRVFRTASWRARPRSGATPPARRRRGWRRCRRGGGRRGRAGGRGGGGRRGPRGCGRGSRGGGGRGGEG